MVTVQDQVPTYLGMGDYSQSGKEKRRDLPTWYLKTFQTDIRSILGPGDTVGTLSDSVRSKYRYYYYCAERTSAGSDLRSNFPASQRPVKDKIGTVPMPVSPLR